MRNSRQEKKVKMFSHLSPRQKGEQNKCQIYSRQEISSSKKSSDSSGTTSLRSMKMSQRGFRLKQTHGQTMCETGVSHQQIVRVTFIHKFKVSGKLLFSGIKANVNLSYHLLIFHLLIDHLATTISFVTRVCTYLVLPGISLQISKKTLKSFTPYFTETYDYKV